MPSDLVIRSATVADAFPRRPWAAHVMSMTRPQVLPHGPASTEAVLSTVGDVDGRPLDRGPRRHPKVSVFLGEAS